MRNAMDSESINPSVLGQTLTTIKVLKPKISENIRTMGRPPSTLASLGLDVAEIPGSPHIQEIRLGEDGSIRVQGRGRLGDATVVAVIPDLSDGSYSVKWKCHINAKVCERGEHLCDYSEGLTF